MSFVFELPRKDGSQSPPPFPGPTAEDGWSMREKVAWVACNTKGGIYSNAETLEGFWAVIEARRYFGRGKEVRLQDFIVLGAWGFDVFGQVSRLFEVRWYDETTQKYVDVDLTPLRDPMNPLAVMTRDEFKDWLFAQNPKASYSLGMGGSSTTPPPLNITCAHCRQAWTTANTHDVYSINRYVMESSAQYIGTPLSQVIKHYEGLTTADYRIDINTPIRNDRYIDMSIPDEKYPTSFANERGWTTSDRSTEKHLKYPVIPMDTYIVQVGDDIGFHMAEFWHNACHQEMLEAALDKELVTVFDNAGYKFLGFTRIPNEYGSQSYRGGWRLITTDHGYFIVGWRKKVVICIPAGTKETGPKTYNEVTDAQVHSDNYAALTEHLKSLLKPKEENT